MGERMRQVRLSLPRRMIENMELVVSMDGRPPAEIIRSVIATYIDAKLVQASLLKNMNLPVPGQPPPTPALQQKTPLPSTGSKKSPPSR